MTIALIEIDFQRWVLALGHRDPVPAAVELRERVTAAGARILCTRYLDRDPRTPHGDPDCPDASFHPALRPGPHDVVLTKHSKDIFDVGDVMANLTAWGVSEVVIDGALTEHGVAIAARSAIGHGLDVTVVTRACAGVTVTEHDRAIRDLMTAGVRCEDVWAGPKSA